CKTLGICGTARTARAPRGGADGRGDSGHSRIAGRSRALRASLSLTLPRKTGHEEGRCGIDRGRRAVDFSILAYVTLTLSLFVSAVKMGGWILNADPRALANAGRWSLIALTALVVALLIWLVNTGRWEAAMMLAAFMLPVVVQAAPRWRGLFGPLNAARSGFPPIRPGLSTPSGGFSTANAPGDPDLVRASIAVLRA